MCERPREGLHVHERIEYDVDPSEESKNKERKRERSEYMHG